MFKNLFSLSVALLCLATMNPSVAETPKLVEAACMQETTTYLLSWSPISNATCYEVRYVNIGTGQTSTGHFTMGTTFTFANLPQGSYAFSVRPWFGATAGEFIGVDDILEN